MTQEEGIKSREDEVKRGKCKRVLKWKGGDGMGRK